MANIKVRLKHSFSLKNSHASPVLRHEFALLGQQSIKIDKSTDVGKNYMLKRQGNYSVTVPSASVTTTTDL
jgi:hypothetical protein